jgi:hypothetical protein
LWLHPSRRTPLLEGTATTRSRPCAPRLAHETRDLLLPLLEGSSGRGTSFANRVEMSVAEALKSLVRPRRNRAVGVLTIATNRKAGRDGRHAHRATGSVLPVRLTREPVADKGQAEKDRHAEKSAGRAVARDGQLQPRPKSSRPCPNAVEQGEGNAGLDPLQHAWAGNHARRQGSYERCGAKYQPIWR